MGNTPDPKDDWLKTPWNQNEAGYATEVPMRWPGLPWPPPGLRYTVSIYRAAREWTDRLADALQECVSVEGHGPPISQSMEVEWFLDMDGSPTLLVRSRIKLTPLDDYETPTDENIKKLVAAQERVELPDIGEVRQIHADIVHPHVSLMWVPDSEPREVIVEAIVKPLGYTPEWPSVWESNDTSVHMLPRRPLTTGGTRGSRQ